MESNNHLPDTNVHQPTVDLVNCAYPMGIPHAHYLTLLSILEKEMSIRSLASVIANIRGGHYSVYMNDVVDAKHFEPDDGLLKTVTDKLCACGFDSWLDS